MIAAKAFAQAPPREGFSLVEVVISSFLMGVMLVAAMKTLGASLRSDREMIGTVRGDWLAQDLLAEIVARPYRDSASTGTIGPEAGESGRASFDDVDDYHGFAESPPRDRDGAAMANATSFERSVTVDYVTLADLSVVSGADVGVKRITVTVRRSGDVVAEAVGIRSDTDELK